MRLEGIMTLAALASAPLATAAPSGTYHLGAAPPFVGLVSVDVVGDGRRDLVAVARGDLSIRILRGDSELGFADPMVIPAANDARRVTSGDVNGDGVPDLLVIGHDNALDVRLGLGGGQFAPSVRYALRNHGNHLAIVDMNGDRFADVVAVHDGSGQPVYVTSFLGSATGELRRVWELGTDFGASMGVTAGDFDHDGRTDVAVAVSDPRASVLVFHGLGTGEFGAPVVIPTVSLDPLTSDGTIAVASGDLDRDGWDDLVIACFGLTNQLVVRRGAAAGFLEPLRIALPSPIAVALGDVNGDGRLDALACNLDHGTLSLLRGRGDGSFEEPVAVPVGPHPNALAVADLDGDGLADAAVTDIGDDAARVYLNLATTADSSDRVPSRLDFALAGPNPIRDEARLRFELPEAGRVRIDVFDVSGRRQPGGIDEELPAGAHDALWQARDLAPGVYVARLDAGGSSASVRLVRTK